jgi:diguanylate cyclase
VTIRPLQTALMAATLVMVALYIGRAVLGPVGVYETALPDTTLLRLGAVLKLALLALAALHAWRITHSLESGNTARSPWRLLALAMTAFAVAQAVLSGYQVVTGVSPFPSPADVFFMAAYPLMIASFFGFIRTYREAGYPVGSSSQHALIAALVSVVATAVAVPLLRPVVSAPSAPLDSFLNAAYPILDFVLLVPMAILLRIAWPFRGGAIFRAWGALLAGVMSLCAGDLLFAWFSTLGATGLDPLLHASYLIGYLCLALGTGWHRDLVAE